jgi:hypothetical protein
VTENSSPRFETLNWISPTFGSIVKYFIYRSDAGGPFNRIATVPGVPGAPPGTAYMFQDNVICNAGGYRYQVTAVVTSDITNQDQEGPPSNTVSTGQNGESLTGCYGPTGFNLSWASFP